MTPGRSKPTSRPEEQEGVVTKDAARTKEPSLYRVMLLNDDYTSMEFVVHVLEVVFNKDTSEAQRIMLQVHQAGRGTAGVYTREIAETKVAITHHLARQHEYPLKCGMEPA